MTVQKLSDRTVCLSALPYTAQSSVRVASWFLQELEGAVAVQAQQGEGDEQQEGEITFMVQVQPDEEEEAAAQPQPGEGGEGASAPGATLLTCYPCGARNRLRGYRDSVLGCCAAGEEIIVQAVDLDGNAVSAEVLAQLQQAHKVVGMGAYQYGESEQPTRVVMGTEVRACLPRSVRACVCV